MNFIITGLPRSRMAWTANYLTYDSTLCVFDAFKYGLDGTGPDCLDRLEGKAKVVGIADSGAALFQDHLIKKYPDAKWVIIQRDWKSAFKAAEYAGDQHPGNSLTAIQGKLEELRAKVDPVIISYDKLNDSIYGLARHINPEWNCPKERHEMLIDMNVQFNPEAAQKILADVKPDNALASKVEGFKLTIYNQAYMDALRAMCFDEPLAYRWIYQAIETALTWDHVIDVEAIDFAMTDRVFKHLLLEWPVNQWFIENVRSLLPVLSSSISAWQASYLSGMPKEGAYSVYVDVPSAVAFILGGQDRVDQFMPKIRQLVNECKQEDDKRDGGAY